MPKYSDPFDYEKFKRNKQARTLAGLIGGFAVFFGGLYYIMSPGSASTPAANEIEQGVVQPPAPMPEDMSQPAEVVQSPIPAPVEKAPVMTPVKKHKKVAKHKGAKKVAKKKVVMKDNLVCIPPSRLKALEKQVARASHR